VNDLKGQLGQMDINQTVDSQELTKIIGEQKNVIKMLLNSIQKIFLRNWGI